MLSGFAQSESPTLLGMAFLVWMLKWRLRSLMSWAVTASLVTGMTCLVRNSNLMLFPASIAIAMRESMPARRRLRVCAVIAIMTMIPILPWTWRNYTQLGTPVLIATNGGENLYMANNASSDGTWEAISLKQLQVYFPDEVKMDRAGMRMARDWILAHPDRFLRLAVMRLRILMSGDDQGAYYSLEKGIGYTGPGLTAARLVANAWWLVWWGLVLTAIRYRSSWEHDHDVYPMLALAAFPALLFLVFQSQQRYHMPMVPPLTVLVGYALVLRRR